jgi:transposase InsO family protein
VASGLRRGDGDARRSAPQHIRSDNGPEFTAKVVRQWLATLNVKTLFIEPGSAWENGYVENFYGKLQNELLDREIFYSLNKAKVLIEVWRRHYNQVRPHSSLGYRPQAPEAIERGSRVGWAYFAPPFARLPCLINFGRLSRSPNSFPL